MTSDKVLKKPQRADQLLATAEPQTPAPLDKTFINVDHSPLFSFLWRFVPFS